HAHRVFDLAAVLDLEALDVEADDVDVAGQELVALALLPQDAVGVADVGDGQLRPLRGDRLQDGGQGQGSPHRVILTSRGEWLTFADEVFGHCAPSPPGPPEQNGPAVARPVI